MGIGSRIREARLACHYTQEELAGLLGVSKGAVANYENGLHTPKEAVLCRLIPALQVDANFLFQDVEGMPRKNPALTQEELRFLEKLRRLSSYDRETLFYLMDRQLMALPERAPESLSQTPAAPSLPPEEPIRLYPFLQYAASAGTGVYSEDMPLETVPAPARRGADFIVGVSGSSMEPMFQDGDLLYVAKTDSLSLHDIGLFSKDGGLYVKEAGADRLLSLNGDFPDVFPEEGEIRVVGRILGKVPREE